MRENIPGKQQVWFLMGIFGRHHYLQVYRDKTMSHRNEHTILDICGTALLGSSLVGKCKISEGRFEPAAHVWKSDIYLRCNHVPLKKPSHS